MNKKWQIYDIDENKIEEISKKYNTNKLLSTILANRNIEDILNAINKLKVLEKANKYGLTKEIIEKSFMNLNVRKDRYTIINRYKNDNEHKKRILNKLLKIIDKEIKIC